MIIAYSGTHGTGKTTAVYDRAAVLKKEFPEKTVGILTEVAARSPYPINQAGVQAGQMWIFTRQISVELSLVMDYDIVVADRTAVDAIAYTAAMGEEGLALSMLDLVWHHMPVYDEINFRRVSTNDYLFCDGVRDEDRAYRCRVEGFLAHFYERLGVTQEARFRVM